MQYPTIAIAINRYAINYDKLTMKTLINATSHNTTTNNYSN